MNDARPTPIDPLALAVILSAFAHVIDSSGEVAARTARILGDGVSLADEMGAASDSINQVRSFIRYFDPVERGE